LRKTNVFPLEALPNDLLRLMLSPRVSGPLVRAMVMCVSKSLSARLPLLLPREMRKHLLSTMAARANETELVEWCLRHKLRSRAFSILSWAAHHGNMRMLETVERELSPVISSPFIELECFDMTAGQWLTHKLLFSSDETLAVVSFAAQQSDFRVVDWLLERGGRVTIMAAQEAAASGNLGMLNYIDQRLPIFSQREALDRMRLESYYNAASLASQHGVMDWLEGFILKEEWAEEVITHGLYLGGQVERLERVFKLHGWKGCKSDLMDATIMNRFGVIKWADAHGIVARREFAVVLLLMAVENDRDEVAAWWFSKVDEVRKDAESSLLDDLFKRACAANAKRAIRWICKDAGFDKHLLNIARGLYSAQLVRWLFENDLPRKVTDESDRRSIESRIAVLEDVFPERIPKWEESLEMRTPPSRFATDRAYLRLGDIDRGEPIPGDDDEGDDDPEASGVVIVYP
jgi:hypothetical protein